MKENDPNSPIQIALAGNPNCGKTSLFNYITGTNQHVGNYPGVTVERRTGTYKFKGQAIQVLDLPGTYSLSGYSPEEIIAQRELLETPLDVVVLVVDALSLKRALVLFTQVLQTGANPVLCLNMTDEARRAGQKIDIEAMSERLGCPVVETVGHKGVGIDALKNAIQAAISQPLTTHRAVFGDPFTRAVTAIQSIIDEIDFKTDHEEWAATRLLLGDPLFTEQISKAHADTVNRIESIRVQLEREVQTDISLYVMQCYYGFIDGLLKEVTLRLPAEDARAVSDTVDKVVVNRFLGIPLFLAVMYAIFWLTFSVGEYPMGWIETAFGGLGDWMSERLSDTPVLESLIVDGIIGGVGGVVVFLPNIVLLFLGLSLLEDTGYMSRAAFLVDRLMHKFGLHGKSFIPMMTGFGCSIPGIMATRTIENETDRLVTMLVLPLMSCGARLPIWMLLIPAFFPPNLRATALFAIYMTGVVLALLLALLLRKTVLRGNDAPLAMELPPYRAPTLRSVGTRMLERSGVYLKKAGTIILAISLIMWALTSYPSVETSTLDTSVASSTSSAETDDHRASQQRLEYSLAGRIGKAIEPIIAPLGFDWKIGVAMIGAFAAKEVFVAQMGIVYAMGETDEESEALRVALQRDYSPLVGISLILFLLISAPCMATIAVTRRESGRWKWALWQLGGLTGIAYVVSLAIYQVGSLFGY